MREKHILIVDDEERLLNMMDFLLVKSGYHVTKAHNGRDAVVKARQADIRGESIDLLITDIDMPEMDGFHLIDAIHKAGLHPKTMAISGKYQEGVNDDFSTRGFSSFLPKPFGPTQLVEEIKAVFRGKI